MQPDARDCLLQGRRRPDVGWSERLLPTLRRQPFQNNLFFWSGFLKKKGILRDTEGKSLRKTGITTSSFPSARA